MVRYVIGYRLFETKESDMFCPKCGSEATEGAKFCGKCGYGFPQTTSASLTGAAATSATGPVATGVKEGRGKRPLIIAIAAVAVIAAALCVWFFVLAPKPCYLLFDQTIYDSNGDIRLSVEWTRDDTGAATNMVTYNASSDETTETASTPLGDGISETEGTSLTYETDKNGDIIHSETIDSETGRLQSEGDYSYYAPHVLKSNSFTRYDDDGEKYSTILTEYDEDGWRTTVVSETFGKYSSKYTSTYTYQFEDDGKTVSVVGNTKTQDGDSSKVYYRIMLNEEGMPSEVFKEDDGKETLYERYTYQKIDHPGSFALVYSNIKQW